MIPVAVIAPSSFKSAPDVIKVDCSFSEEGLLSRFNEYRQHDVIMDSYLDSKSQTRANSLDRNLDNHVGFRVMWRNNDFARYKTVAEVLTSNNCSSTEILFNQWRRSPDHWAAITDESYDVVGIGYANNVAVAIFGDLKK